MSRVCNPALIAVFLFVAAALALAAPASAAAYTILDQGTWGELGGYSGAVNASGQVVGFSQIAGNTAERTTTTSVRTRCDVQGSYRLRLYNSLLGRWTDEPELRSLEHSPM